MNVILLKDVEKLGLRGEVVNVARGYARNFLLPRNLAEVATEGRVKEVKRIDAQKAMHEARSTEQANEIAETLGKLVLRFDVKSGPTGSLFGSVTTTDIADEIWRIRKIRVDRRKIGVDNIKRIGRYTVPIELFEGISAEVKLMVVPEGGELPPEEELAAMEAAIRKGTIQRLMIESGVTFIDPASVYISSRAAIGRDTVIHPGVTIEGNSRVGENCLIRSGTRIKESVIGNNVEVRDNCTIRDSEVGNGCTLGPMAHLRGHAVMQDAAKVGNFVEMKKSNLGPGSKASHLTYLGDATIGKDTNIGAGTITCNYDGKNKHETHIGDNVKIGSDTMLIAPISVGDRAVTGAGSVVTKDIEPDTLVAGVPARVLKHFKETRE